MLAFTVWALFEGGGTSFPAVLSAAIGASFFSPAMICNAAISIAFKALELFRDVLFNFKQHVTYFNLSR